MRVCALAYRVHEWQLLEMSQSEIEVAKKELQTGIVLHGPFKGLRYPDARAAGSSLFPKLIGSYEMELHEVVEQLIAETYSDVIDIGCAEGYYAVGFALRKPDARVWAFDSNPTARELCLNMARANGVDSRIAISARCDAAELISMPIGERALVFCDCEGFEKVLFTPDLCQKMNGHDFVIEVHDIVDPFISRTLAATLKPTHCLERIRNIPDILRPLICNYTELDSYRDSTRISLLAERRPMPMEWFVCRSRSGKGARRPLHESNA